MFAKGVEMIATFMNLCGNACLLYKTCYTPNEPMPRIVVFCQATANCLWITYALIICDTYLLTTSSSSFIMQSTSLFMLSKYRPARYFVKISSSETQLPCVPLSDK